MVIITFIIVYLIASAWQSSSAVRKKQRKQIAVANQRRAVGQQKEAKRYQRECERQQRQAEREYNAMLKAEAKAEALRQKQEQAEADIEYITHRLDTVSDLLNMADSELADVETQIEINEAMHKYDANKKLNQQKEKLHKKILGYEATIHSLESKLAKANYVLSM